MANPDLARNPDYAAMRQAVISEAIRGCRMSLRKGADPAQDAVEGHSTWIHIALLYTIADDHAMAQDAYRQAIRIAEEANGADPADRFWFMVGQTHSHLAMELWDVGQRAESEPHFRRASEAFRRAIERDPASAGTLQSSAWFLSLFQDLRFRDPQRALEHARRLVALTSEQQDNRRSYSFGRRPVFTLGLAEYRMGNLDAARKALERSIELREGGDAYEWFVLAMVVARRGDVGRARELHGKAVRWMRMNRYSDFELHALDTEAAELLDSLARSTPRTGPTASAIRAGVPVRGPHGEKTRDHRDPE